MTTEETTQTDRVADTDETENLIARWLDDQLGARIVRIDRQGRWRPAWFVEAERDGKPLTLYIRGERTENFLPYDLRREHAVHELLEAGGVRVPHVYGYIDALPGTVMACVAGRPNLGTCDDDAERAAILKQLAEQMVLMHGLDTTPFKDAGLRLPEKPRDVTLSQFQDFYDNYSQRKKRPDPALEFCSRWVLRNAPDAAEPARYTACDAGQFLFEGNRLTAMMDFELSVLGDPLMDLAALRIRGQWEDLGHLPDFYRLYEEISGRRVDLQKVRFHTAAFSLAGALASAICMEEFLEAPSANADYVEYRSWVIWELKQAIEAIGEYLGIALPPPVLPQSASTRMTEGLFAMQAALDSNEVTTEIGAYRQRVQQWILANLKLQDQFGAAFEESYLADAAQLLVQRPETAQQADALLEEFVLGAGPEADEALLRLLHRETCRQAYLLAVPGSHYIKGLTEPLLPI